MPTGAELFVQTIQQFGIGKIFTLVGDHLNPVLSVASRTSLDIIHMRHEAAVVHAADAYARVTRQPALSLVTGGPGHTNSLTGLATAYLAASPVIAVSGSRPQASAERQAFQDIDQLGMAKPVVKWAAQPTAASQIPFYLSRAYAEATTGRRGPVHLTIPVDVFSAEAPAVSVPVPLLYEGPAPAPAQVQHALALLRHAQRPVVIAGSGAWWADGGTELQQFVERASLPLFTIGMARGLVRDDHPFCFGYADPALSRAAYQSFQGADLFLILGKRIDFRLGLGSPRVIPAQAQCIQVDIHPQELGMNRALELGICADLKQTLKALLQAYVPDQPPSHAAWLNQLHSWREEWRSALTRYSLDRQAPLHPASLYPEMLRALPPDTLLAWDGGDFTHWGRTLTPAVHPGGWIRLGPLATIGAALPNGIALKLAHPDQPVAVITGDGALGFYIAEIDTAVRYQLPLVLIVGNDAGWGLERELQGAVEGTTAACELRSTRYDRITEAFGGAGETVEYLEQVVPAIERAFRSRVPYCVNVLIRGARSPFTEWTLAQKTGALRTSVE
jgi:thiamine pyrophosphate-dependent acetolactate synthase large subunit-like protein